MSSPESSAKIPRQTDDFTEHAAATRRAFATEQTGASLKHLGSYSLDPASLPGNVEHFMGVAQIPIGLTGPVKVNGEHAQGEFWVPMATTEGTLVASYNRGMKLTRLAGGVTTTIVEDRMQRAPVFTFPSAREASAFRVWLDEHEGQIRGAAEATTSTGKLLEIEKYVASRYLYTRFDYSTGDAAGQNMTGKATRAACEWIVENHPDAITYTLEGGIATDKKHSFINSLRTRGKRVIAEALIPDALLREVLHATTADLYRVRNLNGMLGSQLAGSVNNGSHSANGITALFIACGQDVANVVEGHAAQVYTELRENGDLYYSITIPSLIVATYGGGTGLATQRECLELMGCYGSGKVGMFTEIVAATVVAGELSLGAAVVADEWVSSHDKHGRNRP